MLQAGSRRNYSITIMKKTFVVLAAVMVAFTGVKVGAQPRQPPPPNPGFNGAIAKLFGDNTAFSATMEFHFTQAPGNEMITPGKVAHLVDKYRFDMDISKVQGGQMPPQAAAQMKQMGMSRMTTITRTDKKLSYILYPDMKAYVEIATQEPTAAPSDYKAAANKLGAETIDGHDCVKNKVVVTGPDGVAHESTVWNASDLKQFPVKIQTSSEQGIAVVMLFKDVKLDKPDAAQFDVPSDFTKYKDMTTLMMSRIKGAAPQ
jgi:hypothetical protein